jgi:hypothetical protein
MAGLKIAERYAKVHSQLVARRKHRCNLALTWTDGNIITFIEELSRAEAESQKLASELLDANMAWASKCEEVAALKAEVERLSAPATSAEQKEGME